MTRVLPFSPSLRQQLTASVSGHADILDAVSQLEEAVCGIYRDAEAEAYSGLLQPWALALKVRGRVADACAEFGDRLREAKPAPVIVDPLPNSIIGLG